MREPVSDSANDPSDRHALASVWKIVSPPLVMILLAVVGAWGYRSGWHFTGKSEDSAVPAAADRPRLVRNATPPTWCDVHGVHVCPLCRPELAELAKPPQTTEAERQRIARALGVRPRAENRRDTRWCEYQIEFPTAEAPDRFGVNIAVAWPSAVTEAVTAPGEIVYQRSRVSRPSVRAAGTVARVFHKVGDA